MKLFAASIVFTALTGSASAQFYYKDIVSTRQNIAQWQAFRSAGVKSVRLNSFEADGQPTEGFHVDETVDAGYTGMTTHTKTNGATETWTFTSYSPQDLLTGVTDTSDTYQSVSAYQYDGKGRLSSITNTSTETDNHVRDLETHLWQYRNANSDLPTGMLKIKNSTDTTFVTFIPDDKGNIGEERATRNNETLPSIYYYYDEGNHLTDIVRYNVKTRRLLPDNIFEYGDGGRIVSMLAVQQGASSYQKWIYNYNEKGLKAKESCYSKQRELLGHIEYQYTYK
jgi:YD repeat-containing protein